jgi:hypothetical protein
MTSLLHRLWSNGRVLCVVLSSVSLVFTPTDAEAQRLSLAPEIGIYIPTEVLLDASDGSVGELEAGPSFGARLAILLGSRIALSVSGAYVPTTFTLTPGAGGTAQKEDARLFNGAGQLVVYLLPPESQLSLFLNGGVGVVSRGGVAFTDDASTSDVSGVFGAGAGLRLGGMAITAGADAYRYTASYSGSTATASEIEQLDIQIKLGIGVPFGGGAGAMRRR